MNINLLQKPQEIKKLIKALEIPIDDINFMPGERQVELSYKSKTIGYLLCGAEGNVMHYQTNDALTQKHLDWHFIYQRNKKEIDAVVFKISGLDKSSVLPRSFRKIIVKSSDMISLEFECRFNGIEWTVSVVNTNGN